MRNAFFFRFPLSAAAAILGNISQFDSDIGEFAVKPVGPLELQSAGFVPLLPDRDPLPFFFGDCVALVMEVQTKILPAAVVNKLLAEKLAEVEASEGRKLGGKARRRLKEDLIHELLPRAFVKAKRVQGYLDLRRGLCVVDCAGANAAEAFVSLIRQARGSFPALPLNAERSPRAELTNALLSGTSWGPFQLGANARFSTGGETPRATLKDAELAGSEEVKALIEGGMTPERVELYAGDSLRADFDVDLRLRRLKMLDGALDQLVDIEAETIELATEAQLRILAGAIGEVFDALDRLLTFSRVD